MVLRDFLPPALRGLMVAAFLAAYMSTIGTQLNWGTSYLVNDFYRRFLVRKASEKHYVLISKIITVILVLASGYVASQLTSISAGMGTGAEPGRGHGRGVYSALVLVARERVERNHRDAGGGVRGSWAVAGALHRQRCSGLCEKHADHRGHHDAGVDRGDICYAVRRRIQHCSRSIAGFIRLYMDGSALRLAPEMPQVRDMSANAFDTVMGCILVYGALFGIGKLVFGEWIAGASASAGRGDRRRI